MTRQEMFDVTGYWNFVFCREIKDLSDNTFCAFKHETDDSVVMYEDQKDGNFVMIGLYTYSKAMKLMNKMKVR